MTNELYFGDNLDVMRGMPSGCVDLIYLDPPFNSKASYNVIFGTKRAGPSQAQAHAFEDMWTWGPDAKRAMDETARRNIGAGELLDAFHRIFGNSAMMAYMAMMAVRLTEMHRVLKPTGSLYLHCDPTASHYLKILLDTVFGGGNFRSELIWKRTAAHSASKRWADVHDTILFYTNSDAYVWNKAFTAYEKSYIERFRHVDSDGRRWMDDNLTAPGLRNGDSGSDWRGYSPAAKGNHWKIPASEVVALIGVNAASKLSTTQKLDVLDEHGLLHWPKSGGFPRFKRALGKGMLAQDIITDIPPLNSQAQERLGYPTQKPVALLERILLASTNEGDVVLDPFCGCGTTIDAAEKNHRKWIGIDITYLAIHVIEARLKRSFGEDIKNTYAVIGLPRDAHDARALAARDWLEFQKWAVMMLGGVPNVRPGADRGIDGVIRYHRVGIEQPNRAIVSVKGGMNVGVDAVHKLKSVVDREKAECGVLVCLDPPTRAMRNEATDADDVGPTSRRVPKIQIITVDALFDGRGVDLPGIIDPPEIAPMQQASKARRGRKQIEGQTEMLLPIAGKATSEETARSKVSRAIRPVDIEVVPKQRLTK